VKFLGQDCQKSEHEQVTDTQTNAIERIITAAFAGGHVITRTRVCARLCTCTHYCTDI